MTETQKVKSKTKKDKKPERQPYEFVKFYDNGVALTVKLTGKIGIRKADIDGKFILLEGENKTLTIGMAKKNVHQLWGGFKNNEAPKVSDFIDLDRAFGSSLDGVYIVSKAWSPKKKKAWIIIKNANSDETYMIATVEDGSRLYLREVEAKKEEPVEVQEVEM